MLLKNIVQKKTYFDSVLTGLLFYTAWDDIDYVEGSTPADNKPTDQTTGKCNGREIKKQIESIKSLLDHLSTKVESCQGSQGRKKKELLWVLT